MDSEPASSAVKPLFLNEESSSSFFKESQVIDDEEPYSIGSTSIVLIGIAIAIASIGIPLVAVITEKPLMNKEIFPNGLEHYGSKPTVPISLSRPSQPGS